MFLWGQFHLLSGHQSWDKLIWSDSGRNLSYVASVIWSSQMIWAITSEIVPLDVRPAKIQISLRIRAGWSDLHWTHFGQTMMQSFFMRTTKTGQLARSYVFPDIAADTGYTYRYTYMYQIKYTRGSREGWVWTVDAILPQDFDVCAATYDTYVLSNEG